MRIKKEASEIWKEYERGISYNTGINLYDNVERNNNFFNDKQWEGVNAPDLDKPVFNFLKPVVNYYTAMLISDDIATNVELANRPGNGDGQKKRGKKERRQMGKTTRRHCGSSLSAVRLICRRERLGNPVWMKKFQKLSRRKWITSSNALI